MEIYRRPFCLWRWWIELLVFPWRVREVSGIASLIVEKDLPGLKFRTTPIEAHLTLHRAMTNREQFENIVP